MAWVLVWLAGISGLIAFSVERYTPLIEEKLAQDVRTSLSISEQSPVNVMVQGHQAILTGSVDDVQQRRDMLDAALSTTGIFSVSDDLQVQSGSTASMTMSADETENSDGTVQANAAETSTEDTASQTTELTDGSVSATAVTAYGNVSGDTSQAGESEVAAADSTETSSGGTDEDYLPDADTVALAQTNQTPATPQSEAKEAMGTVEPEMNLEIRDGILSLNGQMASSDKMDELLQVAQTSLDLSAISNYVVNDDSIASAPWLEPVTSLLPALSLLDQPGLEIVGDQIVLSGNARDEVTYDAVVNEALQTLADYTLVEDIDIVDPTQNLLTTTVDQELAATTSNNAEQTLTDSDAMALAEFGRTRSSSRTSGHDTGRTRCKSSSRIGQWCQHPGQRQCRTGKCNKR